jgi:hypothetical protein
MSPSHPPPAPARYPRQRHGSHRTRHGIAGAVLPSLLAVLAVASLITALAVWRGEDPGPPSAAASTSSPTSTREALSRAPSTSATPSATPAVTATTTPAETSDAGTRPADFAVEVVVLNQTSRAGLAGLVATRLRDKGWDVPVVGNFHGVVPATTVYYPAGQEAAAQAAAESLPTTPRTRPRFGNLSTSRLTVVVTDSYPS